MTENEILNALQLCAQVNSKCTECPYFPHRCADRDCIEENVKDLLELINRQKAEIERLQSEFSTMRDTVNLYKNENEKWKAKVEALTQEKLALGRIYVQKLTTVKYEAYKEFAEKLKEKRWAVKWRAKYVQVVIDNLLKEMVGEEE